LKVIDGIIERGKLRSRAACSLKGHVDNVTMNFECLPTYDDERAFLEITIILLCRYGMIVCVDMVMVLVISHLTRSFIFGRGHGSWVKCGKVGSSAFFSPPKLCTAVHRPGGDVFSTKHDITASLRVAEYGERVWLFHKMGRGMNPWAIGIASNMYFIKGLTLAKSWTPP
jgi:hypothetical protein